MENVARARGVREGAEEEERSKHARAKAWAKLVGLKAQDGVEAAVAAAAAAEASCHPQQQQKVKDAEADTKRNEEK